MRNIKFRAWDGKKMYHYPNWSTLHDCTCLVFENNHDYVDESDYDNNLELMQYTGLKDKNGKEIYEGDILVPENKEMKRIVKFGEIDIGEDFHEHTFVGWYLQDNDGNSKEELNSFEVNSEYRKVEVIGNIHENPELLKK